MVVAKLSSIMPPGAPLVVCEPNGRWLFSRLFWNRAARVFNPVWIYWRLANRRRIASLAQTQEGRGEPAFHEHITDSDIQRDFEPFFELVSCRTSFAVTRLHEGVVLDPGWTVSLLGVLDRIANAFAPRRGGSIQMVFRKR